MRLNPQQAQAVRYTDGPLLVLAGAGSGKTAVITQKIAHLIRDRGYLPERIAAITFTNKAAREMRGRAGKLLGETGKGLIVSTFHSLGLRFLSEEAARVGYRRGFSIFDPRDIRSLLKELLPASAKKDTLENIAWQISAWKSAGQLPDQALESVRGPADVLAAQVYKEYSDRLQRFNAVDFDDLILLPLIALDTNEDIRQKWQGRLRHILVDEYQDTNACQYRLLKRLVGEGGSLTAVGDDDQSIYGWRGAQPENLALLKQDYPALRIVKLEQNYRSVRSVLTAANAVIANNEHLFDKALWSELGAGDPLRVFAANNAEHEAEKVAAEIKYQRMVKKLAYSDFAVLYRSNHQARALEQMFRASQIPYRMSGGPSFFDRAEIKDLLAYLRLIVNPRDDGAFLRVVNTPRREIGLTSVERLAAAAAEKGQSLLATGQQPVPGITPRAAQSLQRFCRWITRFDGSRQSGSEVFDDVLRETEFVQWVKTDAPDRAQGDRRAKAVLDLRKWIDNLETNEPGKPLEKTLHQLSLETSDDDESNDDSVSLMTLHASKGLEFPYVFMVGVEEGILPHEVSLDEGNVAEERRLMYVGITRAQRSLTLSYARTRRRFGEVERGEPSRFLDEIPDELVHWEGKDQPADSEESKLRGRAHLANLKAMFDD